MKIDLQVILDALDRVSLPADADVDILVTRVQEAECPQLPLASRCFASVGYDADREVLEMVWRDGRAWRYPGVPAAVWGALKAAPSANAVWRRLIKGRYAAVQIAPRRRTQ